MGLTLTVEVQSGKPCPVWFSQSDSKSLVDHLAWGYAWKVDDDLSVLSWLETRLGISFGALARIAAGQEMTLEEILESGGTVDDYDKERDRSRNAWQPVGELIAALEAIVGALREHPALFEELASAMYEPVDDLPYFADGVFRADLEDLLRMARWAEGEGEALVRITIA